MKILGIDTVTIRNIMGMSMPAAGGDEDVVGAVKLIDLGDTAAEASVRMLVPAGIDSGLSVEDENLVPTITGSFAMTGGMPSWTNRRGTVASGNLNANCLRFPQADYNTSNQWLARACVEVPYTASLNAKAVSDEFSFSIWSLKDTYAVSHYITQASARGLDDSGADAGWILRINNSNVAEFYMRDGGTWEKIDSNRTADDGDNQPNVGQWYHYVITFNGSVGKMYIGWKSGSWADPVSASGPHLQSSTLSISSWTKNSTKPFQIGLDPSSNIYGWAGRQEEACYWDTVLDANAIKLLFNSGSASAATTVSSSNIVGYWKMNETSGTTVVDHSAYENNGTVKAYNGG